jgi:hypothetical protein
MSKGEKLGKLLSEGEKVHAQMRDLFFKNNLSSMDLKELPEEDQQEWYRLKAITEKLSADMCNIISSNE